MALGPNLVFGRPPVILPVKPDPCARTQPPAPFRKTVSVKLRFARPTGTNRSSQDRFVAVLTSRNVWTYGCWTGATCIRQSVVHAPVLGSLPRGAGHARWELGHSHAAHTHSRGRTLLIEPQSVCRRLVSPFGAARRTNRQWSSARAWSVERQWLLSFFAAEGTPYAKSFASDTTLPAAASRLPRRREAKAHSAPTPTPRRPCPCP